MAEKNILQILFGGITIKGDMAKIVVIDSGISPQFETGEQRSYKIDDGKLIKSESVDNNGHGTYVNQLIQYASDKRCLITNYRLLNNELRGKSKDLLIMLENIPEDTDIINLSLSTPMTDSVKDLERICEKLIRKDILIIASVSNKNQISYPAEFSSAFGVKGEFFKKSEKIRYEINGKFYIVADKTPIVVKSVDGGFTFFGGNSKSTAYVSGVLAKIIKGKGSNLSSFLNEINQIMAIDMYDIHDFEYYPNNKNYDINKIETIKLICENTFQMKYEDYANLRVGKIFTNENCTLTKLLHSLMNELRFSMDNRLIRITDFKNAYSIYDAFNL
ncbi:hypothetical protein J7E73_20585 [Paenibacillus albidus]|uniref:S8 family serine peptidase n=1 Tax=Paenibacillus albidus TaxID=2041023 RepID=UPI001BED0771|nr:S8 family serine peptidase [Paenibacillus albidus]MBT2291475.1 hypothetical protein [Paenibacillus albidus]